VKVAIIDSGIHPDHPHVERVAGGIAITVDGVTDDWQDRLGHGTAVAGAIREKAPDARLYAVKVFDRRLSANIEVLIRALQWCIEHRMDLINLSLGTSNQSHRSRFESILATAPPVIAAATLLPGMLSDAIAVAPDQACPRDQYRYQGGVFQASPYPRSIPGVPVERNLHGASFAVANLTGFAARLASGQSAAELRAELIRAANNP
jgi:hypothetical protein